MKPTKINACWVQRDLLLKKPSNGANDYSINSCEDDILSRQPIYLTVAIKGAASDVDPLVQLARWNAWSRLNEVRNGVQGNHFVLPAISVEGHLWSLYFHTYDPQTRHLVSWSDSSRCRGLIRGQS